MTKEDIFNEMEYKQGTGISDKFTILNFDIYKGYQYYILNLGTHPCSYILLDKDDKLYGKSISELDDTGIYCHGGFSYASNVLHSKTYSYVNEFGDKWVIGWDYAHYRDWTGLYSDEINLRSNNKKWTTVELVREVRDVIDDLCEYNKE